MRTLILLLLSGCAHLSIPIEAQHLSHVSQHFEQGTSHGAETFSTGLRWRGSGVTVDLLDGWTSGIDGRHEVFSARIATEIPLHR